MYSSATFAAKAAQQQYQMMPPVDPIVSRNFLETLRSVLCVDEYTQVVGTGHCHLF